MFPASESPPFGPWRVRPVSDGPVTCVYRVYERDELVVTGRLTLDVLPEVGEELRLNGRMHVVREVTFSGGSHVLTLEPRG